MVEDFFKLESFANFFERENAEKIFDFNYCLLNANSTRKEASEKKLLKAEPVLKCLNDNLPDYVNNKFIIWGSSKSNMANEYSDVDFVIRDVNDYLDDVRSVINKCGFKLNRDKIPRTDYSCNTFEAYVHDSTAIQKYDLSIQFCNIETNYDYHCMNYTTEFQKDMIWCLNQELKYNKPKQKLWDKSIFTDYHNHISSCDFMTRTKI